MPQTISKELASFIDAGTQPAKQKKRHPVALLREAHLAAESSGGVHPNGCWRCGGPHLTASCQAVPPERYEQAALVIESASHGRGCWPRYRRLVEELRDMRHDEHCAERAAKALDTLKARLV